jgi:hypothetical protein
MDVLIPLEDDEVHVYYVEGSSTYQIISREPRISIHHEHTRLDATGLRTLRARDRERLLEIRAELFDVEAAAQTLIHRTLEAIREPPGPDERIIRLRALMNDLELSLNRIARRASRLAELEDPFGARRAKEPLLTARLLEGTPLARLLTHLIDERERIETEHDDLLETNYPYLSCIATPPIASRLLTLAGGIKSLASAPASRIQLLGAETALFRHLKNPKQKPPKHGIIHEHPLMQRVAKPQRGRLARIIADKIAIAARVDYFGTAKHEDIKATWNELEEKTRTIGR